MFGYVRGQGTPYFFIFIVMEKMPVPKYFPGDRVIALIKEEFCERYVFLFIEGGGCRKETGYGWVYWAKELMSEGAGDTIKISEKNIIQKV